MKINSKIIIDRIREQLIYWSVTLLILVLGIPLVLFRGFHFLVQAAGAPLKSGKNFIGFLVLLFALTSGYLVFEFFVTFDFRGEVRSLVVNENDRFRTIAANLKKGGLVRGEYLFRAAAIMSGVDKMIIPGRYDFTGKVSLYDVLVKLRRQDIAVVRLTVPEGFPVSRVAALLSQQLQIDAAAFVARAFDTGYVRSHYGADNLEGYLFPDTYLMWYGISIDAVINMMVAQYQKRTVGLFESLPPTLQSPREVLILASIIQAEAGVESEMPLISSVYHNRLREKMLLQADPTVAYGLGTPGQELSIDDLKSETAFNTYLRGGLPPAPINSPGLAALQAALRPLESRFLYFVADGSGRHIFSRTLDEHNWARQKIRAIRRIQGKNQN